MNTRAEIIEGARRLLLDEGYAGTTVGAIKKHVGVGAGTLYHHFPANAEGAVPVRDQIVGHALRSTVADAAERLLDRLARDRDVEADAENDVAHDAPPSGDPLTVLRPALSPESPLVRFSADRGLLMHLEHRRTVSEGLDVVMDETARQTDAARETVMAAVALILGLRALERLYRGARAGDEADGEAEREADFELLLARDGHTRTLRRRASLEALDSLRSGTGDR